tara:strand:+ start:13579 stop:14730 length:1152 start_codon:yes stop_codon:yes gene_type:complete
MLFTDRLKLNSQREYTDEGFLVVPSRIARTGIQEYLAAEMGLSDREPTDIIKVFRPEEEVFSETSLSSFASKPITNNHPSELVNPNNAKEVSVGFSGPEVTQDGMFAKTTLHITDATAIKNIESGKVELSNGYTCDIDWEKGVTPEGVEYDAVQRNIKGNHIAIVERGRAGSSCRVADNLPTKGDNLAMAKITIDGVDFELSDQAAQAVAKLQGRVSDAEKETSEKEEELKKKEDEKEEELKKAQKSEDSLQAKLDEATSKIPTADSLDSLVASRTAMVDSALKIDPDFKWEGKDAEAIRKEIVLAKCPTVDGDSVSAEYIQARFDMLAESLTANPQQNLDNAFAKHVENNDNKTVVDSRPKDVIAREKFMADSKEAWKGGKK